MKTTSWYGLYFFGLRLGISTILSGQIRLGLRSLLNPVRSGFNRYIEAPYAINNLDVKEHDRVLDISSPKHFALFIRSTFSVKMNSVDIMEDFIPAYKMYGDALGLDDIQWEVQDARKLGYNNGSFDKVYSISVIEHIPNEGDTLAAREIGRILKPGGRCTITVPFSNLYREVFTNTAVYERGYQGRPVFFYRFYDLKALQQRLIIPSCLKPIEMSFYRSRLGIELLWDKLPRFLQMSLHWAGPLLCWLSYTRIDDPKHENTSGFCCITLVKDSN